MKPTAVVGRRVGAFLLDCLVVFAFNAAVFFALADTSEELARKLASGELSPNATAYVNVTLGDSKYSVVGGGAGLYFLITFVFAFAYWVVLQGKTGWTLGKRMVGIRLVRDDGSTPAGVWRSLVRQLLWIVDSFPYLIPYLTGFVTAKASSRNKRVGDMVAGTIVVAKEFVGQPASPSGLPSDEPFAQAPEAAFATEQAAPESVASAPVADWYPDPQGEKRLRYWDGSAWTDQTAD